MSRKSVLVLAAVSTFASVLWFTGNAMALPGSPARLFRRLADRRGCCST